MFNLILKKIEKRGDKNLLFFYYTCFELIIPQLIE
tara:strand:+ start:446 stop:550 length:105 start_codon:yes stop_codon:yes gene_type:complete